MDKLPLDICNKINDYVNDLKELDDRKEMVKEISNEVLDHFYRKRVKDFYKDNGTFSHILAFCLIIFIYLLNTGNIKKENESLIIYSFILLIISIISIFPMRN